MSLAIGGSASLQCTVAAQSRRLNARRQRISEPAPPGMSLHQIAKAERSSHGTVASDIARAFEAIRKAAHGEPRYNKIGRGKARGRR